MPRWNSDPWGISDSVAGLVIMPAAPTSNAVAAPPIAVDTGPCPTNRNTSLTASAD
ncbi:MAG: hypothetical protein PHP05_09050 [Sideroxydans sp.]|nr:hypothetical protein [Sideroxydans sp.]